MKYSLKTYSRLYANIPKPLEPIFYIKKDGRPYLPPYFIRHSSDENSIVFAATERKPSRGDTFISTKVVTINNVKSLQITLYNIDFIPRSIKAVDDNKLVLSREPPSPGKEPLIIVSYWVDYLISRKRKKQVKNAVLTRKRLVQELCYPYMTHIGGLTFMLTKDMYAYRLPAFKFCNGRAISISLLKISSILGFNAMQCNKLYIGHGVNEVYVKLGCEHG